MKKRHTDNSYQAKTHKCRVISPKKGNNSYQFKMNYTTETIKLICSAWKELKFRIILQAEIKFCCSHNFSLITHFVIAPYILWVSARSLSPWILTNFISVDLYSWLRKPSLPQVGFDKSELCWKARRNSSVEMFLSFFNQKQLFWTDSRFFLQKTVERGPDRPVVPIYDFFHNNPKKLATGIKRYRFYKYIGA